MVNTWVTYNAATNNLNVYCTNDQNRNPFIIKGFSLDHHIDLRKVLPEWVTIGFSVATRLYTERHVIHSKEFMTNLDYNGRRNKSKENSRKKKFLIDGRCAFFLHFDACSGHILVATCGVKEVQK